MKDPPRKRKMLLLLPKDYTYYYKGLFKRSISYAPLTLTTLAALVPEHLNFDIELLDEGIQSNNTLNNSYDVVGITCVASSAPRAYELADHFRKEGSLVILGGAHPTLNPEEASMHADVVVVGYAEKVWPELLEDFIAQRPLKNIYTSQRESELSSPLPIRSLLPKKKYLNIPTVIASRGCRHHCSYCSIHKIWHRSACIRPVDEVIDEISQLSQRSILMLDPNIIADKNYAAELFEKMIPLNKRWGGLATLNLAKDPGLFDLACRSGLVGILVGFESIFQESLDECNKQQYSPAKYEEYIDVFHRKKVAILGCFVFGFDHDDESVFRKTLEFIDDSGIDLPRFAVLTPFPGTTLYDQMKSDNRIIHDDLSLYDTEHVVFQPKNMNPERLQEGLYWTWKNAYSLNRVVKRSFMLPKGKALGLAINMGFRHYAYKINKRQNT